MTVGNNQFGLSEIHQRFADEYLVSLNATYAFMTIKPDASYGVANSQSCKWMKRADVQAYLNWKREGLARKSKVTAEEIMAELKKLGFSNMGRYTKKQGKDLITDFTDTTEDEMAAIQEITVETYVEGRGDDAETVKKIKFKTSNKHEALHTMAKIMGLIKSGRGGDDEEGADTTIVIEGGLADDDGKDSS